MKHPAALSEMTALTKNPDVFPEHVSLTTPQKNITFKKHRKPTFLNAYPQTIFEDVGVTAYPHEQALFDVIFDLIAEVETCKRPPAIVANLNVHAANLAHRYPRFKQFLQQADTVFCDGVGIQWASYLVYGGPILPRRLTAGDFLPTLLQRLAQQGKTAYFLGWHPDVVERGVEVFTNRLSAEALPNPIVGYHHGYIHENNALEEQVLKELSTLEPDVLLVGFGMPLQEYWIEEKLPRLRANVILPIGATLDYFSGRVRRSPGWIAHLGMEWLWRLCLEPRRMFHRYVVGNPAFLTRLILSQYFFIQPGG